MKWVNEALKIVPAVPEVFSLMKKHGFTLEQLIGFLAELFPLLVSRGIIKE